MERELVACVPIERGWWEQATYVGKSELAGQAVEQLVQVGQQLASSQGVALKVLRQLNVVPLDEAEERELYPMIKDGAGWLLLRGRFTTVPMPATGPLRGGHDG